MKILSLFDGQSCGQLALNRSGIDIEKYYASEIDKYAIAVTQYNFPNTIQLGDVTKWKDWDIESPDMIIGGSPCQSFSFAGNRKGMSTKDNLEITSLEQYRELKEQEFEFEGQSYLFWEYVDILNHYKPKYFLLENVRMEKKWENIISKAIGINPVLINSSLVSAQNRNRLYWTNINTKENVFGELKANINQPEDKKIYLKDIIIDAITEKDKSYCLDANYMKGASYEQYVNKSRRQLVMKAPNGKDIIIPEKTESPFMLTETRSEKGKESRRKIRQETGKDSTKRDKDSKIYIPNNNGKANCILTSNADELSTVFYDKVKVKGRLNKYNFVQEDNVYDINGKSPVLTAGGANSRIKIESVEKDSVLCISKNYVQYDLSGEGFHSQEYRMFNKEGKSNCINVSHSSIPKLIETETEYNYRKLLPIECERLQTLPDFYTQYGRFENDEIKEMSNSARYRMIGNGWTVSVISHIFDHLSKDKINSMKNKKNNQFLKRKN